MIVATASSNIIETTRRVTRETLRKPCVCCCANPVSTDDGYTSAKGRDDVLAMKVKDISISGAKDKKLTAPGDWESEEYRDARRNRSAVESLMFTIKDGFEFGELGRRGGLNAVVLGVDHLETENGEP